MRIQLMKAEAEFRNERCEIMGAEADNAHTLKEAGGA